MEKNRIERCEICLQPTTPEYKFYISYFEDGNKITKIFCGAICLRNWIETDLDKIHLGELKSLE